MDEVQEPTTLGSLIRRGPLVYVLMRTDRGKWWVALDQHKAYDLGSAYRMKPGTIYGEWSLVYNGA